METCPSLERTCLHLYLLMVEVVTDPTDQSPYSLRTDYIALFSGAVMSKIKYCL